MKITFQFIVFPSELAHRPFLLDLFHAHLFSHWSHLSFTGHLQPPRATTLRILIMGWHISCLVDQLLPDSSNSCWPYNHPQQNVILPARKTEEEQTVQLLCDYAHYMQHASPWRVEKQWFLLKYPASLQKWKHVLMQDKAIKLSAKERTRQWQLTTDNPACL